MAFPTSPANNDLYVSASKTLYQYSNVDDKWIKPKKVLEAWTPANVTTSAWFDASDIDTVTESGGLVSQWDDKSGNANHLKQALAAFQFNTGVSSKNGLNVLGSNNDYMQTDPLSVSFPTSGDYSVYVVTEIDLSGSNFDGMFSVLNDAASRFQLLSGSAASWNGNLILTGMGTGGSFTGGPYNGTGYHIWQVNFDFTGSIVNGHVDAVQQKVDTAYTAKVTDPCTFALSRNDSLTKRYYGKFAEVVVAENGVGVKAKMEGYLAWKWGLVGNLPVGHPYKNSEPTV